jgi:hypothetical protein
MERKCSHCHKKDCGVCGIPVKVLLKEAAGYLGVKKSVLYHESSHAGNTWTLQAGVDGCTFIGVFHKGEITNKSRL